MSLFPPSTTNASASKPTTTTSNSRPTSRSSSPAPSLLSTTSTIRSSEPLIAHPLLAHPVSTSSPLSTSTNNANAGTGTPPKYLPYTPRHRAVGSVPGSGPGAATHHPAASGLTLPAETLSSVSATDSHAHALNYGSVGRSAGALGGPNALHRKLQMTNLQSAAQTLGLECSSSLTVTGGGKVGWMMVEWLISLQGGPERDEIWEALIDGKATLLLPLDQASKEFTLTSEFIKDHIVFLDEDDSPTATSARRRAETPIQAVTLSGLRGILDATTFTLLTSLAPSSAAFKAIASPATRAAAFAALPPLPVSHASSTPIQAIPLAHSTSKSSSSSSTSSSSSFTLSTPPSYTLGSYTPSLPLPVPVPVSAQSNSTPPIPIPSSASTAPPLPPRPGTVTVPNLPPPTSLTTPVPSPRPATPSGAGHSRLLTLASLFGGRGYGAAAPTATHAPPTHDPLSTPPSPSSTPSTSIPTSSTIGVPTYTLTASISRSHVGARLEEYILMHIYHRSLPSSQDDTDMQVSVSDFDTIYSTHIIPLIQPLLPLIRIPSSSSSTKRKSITKSMRKKHRVRQVSPGTTPTQMNFKFGLGEDDGDAMWIVNDRCAGWRDRDRDGGDMAEKEREDGDASDADAKVHLAKKIQDTYIEIEDAIRERVVVVVIGGGGDKKDEEEGEGGRMLDEKMREKKFEHLVIDILGRIEGVVCEMFYDRLFSGVEDAAHDESLLKKAESLRDILGLDELGVRVNRLSPSSSSDNHDTDDDDTDKAEKEVTSILSSCARVLARLDSTANTSPARKAALLIEAHKVLVDGFEGSATVWVDLKPVEEEQEENPQNEKNLLPSTSTADVAAATETSSTADQSLPLASSSRTRPPPLSSDLLLPLLIYTLIHYSPTTCPHLLSHLLYIQRFRCPALSTGEEAFCLVNLLASVEYVLSAASQHDSSDGEMKTPPSPISIFHPTPSSPSTQKSSAPSHTNINPAFSPALSFSSSLSRAFPSSLPTDMVGMASLKGRVDVLAGSANKVISGVMDSSFGILKSLPFLPGQEGPGVVGTGVGGEEGRPGALGLLSGRSPSGLSIRSMLPARASSLGLGFGGGQAKEQGEFLEENRSARPMVVVSRPGSLRAVGSDDEGAGQESDEEGAEDDSDSEDEDEDGEGGEEESSDEDEDGEDGVASSMGGGGGFDTRSIRSFESMMKDAKPSSAEGKKARKSLSDRLATVSSGLAAGPKGSPRNSLIPQPNALSTAQSHPTLKLAPPKERFMFCADDACDLKLGEVAELLREYRRIVEGVRAVGGFQVDGSSLNSTSTMEEE